jgi:phage terminase large subunit
MEIQPDSVVTSPKPYINLWGNHIYFRGLDGDIEATGSDILFFNELLEVDEERSFGDWCMRCRLFIISDWNPKYTAHWVFNYEKRPNCYFTRTTYKNNKHLEQSIINDLEATSPWMIEDLHLPENDRRPHEYNIKHGTVNKVRFMVYGMGLRFAAEGVVFPNITWIDQFPKDCERVFYGLDYGYTSDPSCLVKVGIKGRDLFLEKLLYQPTESLTVIEPILRKLLPSDDYRVWADMDTRDITSGLQQMGYSVYTAKKYPGCITARCEKINRHRIHIVHDPDAKKEADNYFYLKIKGIQFSEPDPNSKFCHFWDAVGYAVQHEIIM